MSIFNKITKLVKEKVIGSSSNIADSSSIPKEERQYYQPDEYYTIKTYEGSIFEFTVIPFNERKKTAFPSQRGLHVPEILMLSFCNSFPNPKRGYPGYWWFKYGVRDVGSMLRSLEDRGFIEIDKTTGKYRTTNLGQSEMVDNEYVAYTHRHSKLSDFTPWDLNKILGNGDKSNWAEIFSKKSGALPPLEKTDTIVNVYDPNNKQKFKKRIPLKKIKNRNNWERGFDQGFPHYQKGEQLRKAGDVYAAIDEFDLARSKGYNSPALYWSYAVAFRKIKDYDNEIEILDEAFKRETINKLAVNFTERLARAYELKNKKK